MKLKSALSWSVALVVVCWLTSAHPLSAAKTLYVANNGVDTGLCGGSGHKCRSISLALAHAANGDTIIVGPGRYGDLNGDGVLGDSPGEELQAQDCACMIRINKSVTLISTQGAKATMIDARTVTGDINNVQIEADNVTFGEAGQGFTVTGTDTSGGVYLGIEVLAGTGISVAGNQVVGLGALVDSEGDPAFTIGMESNSTGVINVQGNQVIGWTFGIIGVSGTTISNNTVEQNRLPALDAGTGIVTNGATVTQNIVTGNYYGIVLQQGGKVTGNNVLGNFIGVSTQDALGTLEKNNIFGNSVCGLQTTAAGLLAIRNFWGAGTGPGPNDLCAGTSAVTTPFATSLFTVNVTIVP